jgi:hypothetical protein
MKRFVPVLILFCALAVSAQTFDNGVTIEQVRAGLTVLSNKLTTLEAERKAITKQWGDFSATLGLQEQSGQITNDQRRAAWDKFVKEITPRTDAIEHQIALVRLQILNVHQRYGV